MTRAIAISLLVIAVLISGISPNCNINQVNDSCCYFDSSYIIDNLDPDNIGIHKINDHTLTSSLGTYSIQSTFYIRETSAVAFRLLIAGGFVDIRVNGVSFRVNAADFADSTVIISQYDKEFVLKVGKNSKIFYAADDIINLTISYKLKAFKLTSCEDGSLKRVNIQHGENYYTNIVGAAGLVGIGVLNGNDYAVENLECGEFYSVLRLETFDLLFFNFLVTFTQQFNIIVEDCILPLPNFCFALKIAIISSPIGASISVDRNIKFSTFGKYSFRLYNDYENYIYEVECLEKEETPPIIPPIVPPDELPEQPEVPPEEVPTPPEEQPIPPEESPIAPPSKPITPSEDNQPPKDVIYVEAVDWLKVGIACSVFAVVLTVVILSIIILGKKKKK